MCAQLSPHAALLKSDIMDNVRKWIGIAKSNPSIMTKEEDCKPNTLSFRNVVLTPDSVPKFTIPGSYSSSDSVCINVENSASSLLSSDSPNHLSAGWPSPASSSLSLVFAHGPAIKAHSAPVSPVKYSNVDPEHSSDVKCNSFYDVSTDQTNADPLSSAALGLTHFVSKTSYGFNTLSATPHTRRRESLFHDLGSTNQFRKALRRQLAQESENHGSSSLNSSIKRNPKLSTKSQSFVSPLGVQILTEWNPVKSISKSQTIKHYPQKSTGGNQTPLGGFSRGRRRSSLPDLANSTLAEFCSEKDLENSFPTHREVKSNSCGSADHPSFKFMASCSDYSDSSLNNMASSYDGLNSELLGSTSYLDNYLDSSSSSDSINNPPGQVGFTIQYIPESKKITVHELYGVNLMDRNGTLSSSSNTYLKLSIGSPKSQKFVTRAVKGTCNPLFPDMISFTRINQEQLDNGSLKIKAYHRRGSRSQHDSLGEAQLSLQHLIYQEEQNICLDILPKGCKKSLSKIHIEGCFQARNEELVINVFRACGLPKHSLMGTPDTYVKVVVTQPKQIRQKQKTSIIKNSCNPVFNECFTFKISPRIEDLKFTSVVIMLISRAHIGSDDVIGHVRLGDAATTESEFKHWNNILQNPGVPYSHTHKLS